MKREGFRTQALDILKKLDFDLRINLSTAVLPAVLLAKRPAEDIKTKLCRLKRGGWSQFNSDRLAQLNI